MEVGLFLHGECFMYRIGPTLYASCEYGINRCSIGLCKEYLQLCRCITTAPNGAVSFFLERTFNMSSELTTALYLSRAIITIPRNNCAKIFMCVWLFLWFVQKFLGSCTRPFSPVTGDARAIHPASWRNGLASSSVGRNFRPTELLYVKGLLGNWGEKRHTLGI